LRSIFSDAFFFYHLFFSSLLSFLVLY
jgi:hypothetical protein